MPRVTFYTADGDEITIPDAADSLMKTALTHGVPGITGDCGGVCSCATCHVKIDPAWVEKVGPAGEAEAGMLELEDEVEDNSRLGCQVKLTDDLDGLVVRVVNS
jgi:ferredoxin, 2Fe-2S